MIKITLPDDLKRYSRMAVLKRMIPCVVLLALAVILMTVYGDALIASVFGDIVTEESNVGYKITAYIVLLAVPFVITGVPHRLMDETYCGDVLSVKVKTVAVNKLLTRRLYHVNEVTLTVATGKGIKEKTVLKVPVGQKSDIERFSKGDVVFHLYGSPHTVKLSSEYVAECAVCGYAEHTDSDKCSNCGHTLINGR